MVTRCGNHVAVKADLRGTAARALAGDDVADGLRRSAAAVDVSGPGGPEVRALASRAAAEADALAPVPELSDLRL